MTTEDKRDIIVFILFILRAICILSALGGIFCGLTAYGEAFVSDEEHSKYWDSLMKPDAYLKLKQIGREYGYITEVYYEYKYIDQVQDRADDLYNEHKDKILKAISNNFAVRIDLERDKEIMRDYERLQIMQHKLGRKMDPHNRFKDTMAWIGGMFSLFLITYVSYKAIIRLEG